MVYWIFMLIMDLLLPITMIGFGKYFSKHAPKEINPLFGYRTEMSMKNEDTWLFANHYFGKIFYRFGWILFPITIVVMLPTVGKDIPFISIIGMILIGVQLIPLIASLIMTEHELHKNFDSEGHRIYQQKVRN